MRENRTPTELRIHLLGGFHVALGEQSIPADAWRLSKARSLLKLLALAPTHRLHREQIFDLLWPRQGEAAALNNLHNAIHAIRHAIGAADPQTPPAAYLRLEQSQLVLCPEAPLWTDVAAFEAAAERARGQTDPAAYEAALALYSGDLLPDDRNEEWTISRRETLRSSYDALLLAVVRRYEARQEYPKAVGALEQIVAHDPAHEQARRQLMRLYALLDQRHLALRQFQLLKEALRQELDVDPARATRQLYEDILAERFPPVAPDPAAGRLGEWIAAMPAGGRGAGGGTPPHPNRRTGQGQPTSRARLIGREQELAALRGLLSETRLLTVIGGDGCGKSRLARRLAADLHDTYLDGIYVVDLAPLTDPSLAPQTVARAVGLPEYDGRRSSHRLLDYLQGKELLLLLDHCDRLLTTCRRLVATLLGKCPDLQILATSQEALGLLGETAWPVPPLSLPPVTTPSLSALRHSDAVRLFLARGQAYHPALRLTAENATAIARLCRQLEGNPLALELAAAHLVAMPLEALVRGLVGTEGAGARDPAAGPERHQPVRMVLEWSYGLLREPERLLLRRLAVFAGNWRREAARTVCTDRELVADQIAGALPHLIERSLVVVEERGRYRLPAPIQRYGAEQLAASGEQAALRQRHAAHFLTVAEQAAQALAGPDADDALDGLEREHDDLRAALHYALETGAVELAYRLAAALWRFWPAHGYLSEGRAWLMAVLAMRGEPPEARPALRAELLHGAGVLALLQGEDAHALARHQEALAVYRRLGNRRGIATALVSIAGIARQQGDAQRSVAHYEEALPLLEAAGDRAGLAQALDALGALRREQGEHAQARALHERALALFEAEGDAAGAARMLESLGGAALQAGEEARAEALLQRALVRLRGLVDTAARAGVLRQLAMLARRRGDLAAAALLLEEALALSHDGGDQEGEAAAQLALARVALGQGDHERALALGAASEQLYRALRQAPGAAGALLLRADVALAQEQPAAARAGYRESLALLEGGTDRASMARCLDGMAAAALALDDPAQAARLLGMAAAAWAVAGALSEPGDLAAHQGLAARVRAALGDQPYDDAYTAGRAQQPEGALMATSAPSGPDAAAPGAAAARAAPARRSLSAREREVALLVAQGQSNRQIADALGMPRRTVDKHVEHVLKKLGIRSRGQVADALGDDAESGR